MPYDKDYVYPLQATPNAKVLNRACERLVRLAKKLGVSLRQSYARVGSWL